MRATAQVQIAVRDGPGQRIHFSSPPLSATTSDRFGSRAALGTSTKRKICTTSSIPFLTNYNSLQGLNPTKAVTATYNAYVPTNGTNESFTFFTICNATTA